jgi:hypothetical protein
MAPCIEFGNSGIFGAGGNNGNSISTEGINDGSSGSVGGEGIKGIFHTFREILPKSISFNCHIMSIPNAKASSRPRERSKSGGDGIFGN